MVSKNKKYTYLFIVTMILLGIYFIMSDVSNKSLMKYFLRNRMKEIKKGLYRVNVPPQWCEMETKFLFIIQNWQKYRV